MSSRRVAVSTRSDQASSVASSAAAMRRWTSSSFEHEQDGRAAPVRPVGHQRHVELAEALAEAFLELLLADRHDAHAEAELGRLGGGKRGGTRAACG